MLSSQSPRPSLILRKTSDKPNLRMPHRAPAQSLMLMTAKVQKDKDFPDGVPAQGSRGRHETKCHGGFRMGCGTGRDTRGTQVRSE